MSEQQTVPWKPLFVIAFVTAVVGYAAYALMNTTAHRSFLWLATHRQSSALNEQVSRYPTLKAKPAL